MEQLVAFAEVLQADAGGLFCGGFGLKVVLDHDAVGLLLADGDIERPGGRYDIVFDAVFDEQLEAEGGDLSEADVRPGIDADIQERFEAGLQHEDIGLEEFELFVEGDSLGSIFSEQLPVEVGQFEDKGFGPVIFFADHDAEGTEGIEEKMRVDLLFEYFEAGFQVLVLQFGIGEQDVFFFRQGGQGGLDGENDKRSQEQFSISERQGGMRIQPERVKWPDKLDENAYEQQIDEDLDAEADAGRSFGGFEPVCDPLVDHPQEEKEQKADDPGAGDPAGFLGGSEEVIVQEADARHEERAEQGKQDLSTCLFGWNRE